MEKSSSLIREKAPIILSEIKKANSILLHCHPSSDPDSVGSALAMKFALESLGKRATLIRGDSDIPLAFMHFPGASEIIPKNYLEIDTSKFDLFIVLDSSSLDRISSIGEVVFPPQMKIVNIDHHVTNKNFGQINLVVSECPATAEILYELMQEWGIAMTPEIACNLLIGIYTDTGGLKYRGATARSFEICAELVKVAENFSSIIEKMDNSNTPGSIAYQGLALNSIETYLDGKLAIAVITNQSLVDKNIQDSDIRTSVISPMLRTVIGWDVDVALVEVKPKNIKMGLRTRDEDKYDVSLLASAFGGGGHKAAAGASINGVSMEEAVKMVVAKVKELYNL